MTSTLILGGARSGKSALALKYAERDEDRRIFIATAQALDDEMAARIARHREDRQENWETVEAPLDLAEAIARHGGEGRAVLIDCLTLWLSNIDHEGCDIDFETEALVAAINGTAASIILVSNEIGLGLVPDTPLGRSFRDAQGRLNQRIAAACDVVEFVAAGLPIRLKG